MTVCMTWFPKITITGTMQMVTVVDAYIAIALQEHAPVLDSAQKHYH